MNYTKQLDALNAINPLLGSQVKDLPNLEAILKWAPSAGVDFKGIGLVQQDEYSYDLYLPLPDSRWLIFGVS